MRATALEPSSGAERLFLAGAVLASLVAHALLSVGVSHIPEREPQGPVWVEMAVAVVEPEPAPQPVPEPEPEPEPVPEPEPIPEDPEVVEFEPEVEEAPDPQPDPKPVPRVVQGLQASSFAEGSGTGLNVRAGTTTSAKATSETMGLDEATESAVVPFVSVTKPPKVRYKPTLEVPESVIAAQLQGRVEILLTIGADGLVQAIEVVSSLHPDADAACVTAMKKSRWKPGTRDETPVIVQSVPYSCRFEMSPD